MDATNEARALLCALLALPGTSVTTTRQASGWLTDGGYGSVTWGHPEAALFELHTVRFLAPLSLSVVADVVGQAVPFAKGERRWTVSHPLRVSGIRVYEQAQLLAERGRGGRGVVLAETFRSGRLTAHGDDIDVRGCPHFTLLPSGQLRDGMFG